MPRSPEAKLPSASRVRLLVREAFADRLAWGGRLDAEERLDYERGVLSDLRRVLAWIKAAEKGMKGGKT